MQAFGVYRSSAGSGKTFTLTKEYLKLALATPRAERFDPYYFRHVLAVTFTNDAANEMKERIMRVLSALASSDPAVQAAEARMAETICQELQQEYPLASGEWTPKELHLRARKVHEWLLHHYSEFAVSTIDRFTNRIVQAFKKDLGFPYSHDIELETDELCEEASLALQREVREGDERNLAWLLVEFAKRKSDLGQSWFIHRDLQEFAQHLFHEEKQEAIQRLERLSPADFEAIRARLREYADTVEEQVVQWAQEAVDTLQRHGIEEKSLHYGKNGIFGFFQKIATRKEKDFLKWAPNTYVTDTLEGDKWLSAAGKKDPGQRAAVEQAQSKLYDIGMRMVAFIQEHRPTYIIAGQLRKNIFLLATINELGKHLTHIKHERRIIHISDFNRSINAIVEAEPVPYIYERIGERYHHILIDEFQDTSRMQWHNLVPLVANGLAEGLRQLVVGDAKQAIYRWRGGNSQMLVRLPELPTALPESALQEQVPLLRRQHGPKVLNSNYRSLKEVVAFNNHFFHTMAQRLAAAYPDLEAYYADVEQEAVRMSPAGTVECRLFQLPSWGKASEELALTLAETVQIIAQLQDDGYAWRDIAILTRTNAHCRLLATYLLAQGIDVVSADSLLVRQAGVVQLLAAALEVLEQPTAPPLRMSLLLLLHRHWQLLEPDRGWEGLFDGEKGPQYLRMAADPGTSLADFGGLLREAFGLDLALPPLRLLPLYETCEALIQAFHLQRIASEQPYLYGFLDFVLEFSGKRGNDLALFLEQWKRKEEKLAVAMPSQRNAVRIMSVHKSKGLQFPAVIVPFADWSTTPRSNSLLWLPWEGAGLLEGLPSLALSLSSQLKETPFAEPYQQEMQASFLDAFNLLYVAFTRPEERLYILGKTISDTAAKRLDPAEGCGSIGEVLHLYLESLGRPADREEERLLADRDDPVACKIWSFAAPEPRQGKAKPDAHAQTVMLRPVHTSHAQSLRVKEEQAAKHAVTLEDLQAQRERQQFGNLMHAAFEQVVYADDIPKAVRRAVHQGNIPQHQAWAMEQQMRQVALLPEIRRYFDRASGVRVLNEQEIMLDARRYGPGTTLRPDRLVLDGDVLVVLDYKTGQRRESHRKQVQEYAFHLREAGFAQVKAFLLYTSDHPEAVEVAVGPGG